MRATGDLLLREPGKEHVEDHAGGPPTWWTLPTTYTTSRDANGQLVHGDPPAYTMAYESSSGSVEVKIAPVDESALVVEVVHVSSPEIEVAVDVALGEVVVEMQLPKKRVRVCAPIGARGRESSIAIMRLAGARTVGPITLLPSTMVLDDDRIPTDTGVDAYMEIDARHGWEARELTEPVLLRLCRLLTLAWKVPMALGPVRCVDRVGDLGPSGGWDVPDWLPTAWQRLHNDARMDRVLRRHAEAVALADDFPESAFAGFMGCLDAVGGIEGHRGNLQRVRAAARPAFENEAQFDAFITGWNRWRNPIVHEGGIETDRTGSESAAGFLGMGDYIEFGRPSVRLAAEVSRVALLRHLA